MRRKSKPKKPLTLSKLEGINDDFINRHEFLVSDLAFAAAVSRASVSNTQGRTLFETHIAHQYEEKLEQTRKDLAARILVLAKEHMKGIQLQAFLLSFQFGVNKCATARSMKVSRQSIQIRNRRAIRKLKRLIFMDGKCRVFMAEMMRLRRKVSEQDE